jgi:hypothetical protein
MKVFLTQTASIFALFTLAQSCGFKVKNAPQQPKEQNASGTQSSDNEAKKDKPAAAEITNDKINSLLSKKELDKESQFQLSTTLSTLNASIEKVCREKPHLCQEQIQKNATSSNNSSTQTSTNIQTNSSSQTSTSNQSNSASKDVLLQGNHPTGDFVVYQGHGPTEEIAIALDLCPAFNFHGRCREDWKSPTGELFSLVYRHKELTLFYKGHGGTEQFKNAGIPQCGTGQYSRDNVFKYCHKPQGSSTEFPAGWSALWYALDLP